MGNLMKEGAPSEFVARYRQSDGTPQSLLEHLEGVSCLASAFAGKIGLSTLGELMGLLHDFGKYSDAFQAYIKSAEGRIEPDDEEYVEAERMRGKIDHSTAGAQHVYKHSGKSPYCRIAAEIMTLCIASHHSGLIDCLSPDGEDVFNKRMEKPEERAHAEEVEAKVDLSVRRRIDTLLVSSSIECELRARLDRLFEGEQSLVIRQFAIGFLARFLFSAVIDADRLNSAERQQNPKPEWPLLIEKLEAHLAGFTARNEIDRIRAEISSSCSKFSAREKGLYQLTVPTGGGKTLASLRFALNHAQHHGMDRVIYVVPYTSIIDQNARVARSVFASIEESGGQVVLEHHSNLTPEQDTWQSKLLSENWDAPIIYTTAVQFLETLFAAGTRGVRRLHQLANSVIVFDEIQTLPVRTVHLFNNAVNFLTGQCGSTVVFCTATQPLLDKVEKKRGAARLSADSQMMTDTGGLFRKLHRVTIEDKCKPGGWSAEEVAETALQLQKEAGSVLIIVNKKAQARELFGLLYGRAEHVHYLSTAMCPIHRMKVLDEVKECLNPDAPLPVICISTQLIEAGVDVDFGSAIRYLAGIDSIAQAAGRCNRNGLRSMGRMLIVNPANENLDSLPEIRAGKEVAERVLHEYHTDPAAFEYDLQSPVVMSRYYDYYFFKRAHEMVFPVSRAKIGRDDDLLTLLSTNEQSVQAYQRSRGQAPPLHLRQSFMAAARAFKVIDSPTEGVIVPYDPEGNQIIQTLCAVSRFEKQSTLLRQAQRVSVNLFPYEFLKLQEKGRLYEIWKGSRIYYLDERHYSPQFGVSMEEVSGMKTHIA
jgi:CRISPR-associated endonuclease/helicase Cas3